ncbi:uncharacterized protein LOC123530253 [Mercenaria mercenaria]|uniref:uncharacterized protein LOC123530253 n=1 Tax=Mercenaria mercenaria TaxID=6596 RepID=UPI00234F6ED9|nr:uncharacterized protein LOC123530253 [Mercenaria mercenaria]
MEAGTARSEPEFDDCEATAAFFMTAKSKRKPQHLAQSSFGSRRQTAQQPKSSPTEITHTPEAGVFHSSAGLHGKGVLLKTTIATVSSTKVQLYTNILFDEGSHKSFITESLAEELELTRNGTETIYLSSFGSTSNKIMQVDTATVYLVTDEYQKIPVKVLIVPTISTPLNNRLQNTASKLPYLRGLKLAHPVTEDNNFTISMLIGADFYWDIAEDRIIRGEGPTAVKSKIGYLLSQPVPAESAHSTNHVCNVNTSHFSPDMLERFWSLESMGITQTTEDNDISDYFKNYQQSCIEFKDSRYSTKLPWKLEHPPLPTNYEVTKKRTENTIRRLQKNPYLLQKYDDIITEQERRGFIEKVITDTPPTGQVHYIPHHPVKKESSTTPIRIVYDCSCRQSPNLPSLNDCLESTPPILNDLSNILVRFRLHKYAVTADIEKAFLHVGLDERDRDATRFLWSGDILNPSSPLCIYRFKAVLFGATCSPFMLSATILKHLELNKHVQAAEVIQRDLYVDNVLSSFESESSACTYFKGARCLMRKAGMNLRSWTSNSEKLRSLAAADGVLDNDVIIKVLGMQWNPNTDELSFTNRSIPSLDVITKRTILKFSSQIYDPLGLLSPVTVRAKILLQELWKSKYDWDIFLPEVIRDSWNQLVEDLNRVTDVKFSRQLLPTQNPNSTTCRHIFVDASIKSYGAVAYFSNEKQTRILMAKNRVAPLKTLTLPQLELMAALIGARLASHLQKSLQTPNVTFWSDSQIVLHWLTTSKPLKRFVRNRVDEINQLTGKSLWRYCPTNDNPADLLTRGISADIFLDNQLWNTGPSWLTNRVQWPTWEYEHVTPQTTTEKNAGNSEEISVSSLQCSDTLGIHNVIDITHYSSYTKLLRVTANVMRFINNCRQNANRQTGSLSASELHDAEIPWLRSCHANSVKEEIENLKGNRNRLPLVRQLRLYLDTDGLIRCGGRIHNAPLEYATKFPYLLPKKHKLTRLVIQDAHGKQLHSGVNATITHLRQKYWIPAIRQCVRSVLRTCVICTRVIGKPYRAPDPPPLPKIRVEEAPPFSVTGVDFTGVLYVRNETGSESKCFICLFTCAITRAVHLEVVPDLSTDSFLQAFRRFSSRKSLPKLMISDNATTYLSAASQLKKLFLSTSLQEALSMKGTEWKFIPKRAPWYGGFWERLIGLTKTTLKKILGRAFVTMETLRTIVTEIEAILNDRPITYTSSNIEDMEPLTPAHLLYGRRMTSLPYYDIETETGMASVQIDQSILTRRAKIQANIINHFWKRWKTEYLTSLREYHKTTGSNERSIRAGDVVQVHDEGPRLRWKLAVVQELITGNDGLVRAAKIKTVNGLTTRPVVKLYPLETVTSEK